jgi:hypothetical protein
MFKSLIITNLVYIFVKSIHFYFFPPILYFDRLSHVSKTLTCSGRYKTNYVPTLNFIHF